MVNLMGCFAIGVVSGLAESRQLLGPELRTFTLIGILGGFTTFSTFGSETFAMIRGEEYLGGGQPRSACHRHPGFGVAGLHDSDIKVDGP